MEAHFPRIFCAPLMGFDAVASKIIPVIDEKLP